MVINKALDLKKCFFLLRIRTHLQYNADTYSTMVENSFFIGKDCIKIFCLNTLEKNSLRSKYRDNCTLFMNSTTNGWWSS